MKYLLIALGAMVLWTGCGKKEQPSANTPAPTPAKSIEDVIQPSPGASAPPPSPTVPAPEAAPGSEPTSTAIIPGAANRPGEPMDPKGVKRAIDQYFEKNGSFANSWQQLIQARLLKAVPLGRNGQPLDFAQCQEWFASNK